MVMSLIACSNSQQNTHSTILPELDTVTIDYNDSVLVPVSYNFKNLKLYLNDKMIDSFWRWDHMNSPNSRPDTTTFESYMNISQPLFSFDGSESLPALYIETYKSNIIHFTVGTILDLPDGSNSTLNSVFDTLANYELLNDTTIRSQLIEKGYYIRSKNGVEEYIKLTLDNQSGYSNGVINYGIQLKSKYNRSFEHYLED